LKSTTTTTTTTTIADSKDVGQRCAHSIEIIPGNFCLNNSKVTSL
jgi:hypothetical protein